MIDAYRSSSSRNFRRNSASSTADEGDCDSIVILLDFEFSVAACFSILKAPGAPTCPFAGNSRVYCTSISESRNVHFEVGDAGVLSEGIGKFCDEARRKIFAIWYTVRKNHRRQDR